MEKLLKSRVSPRKFNRVLAVEATLLLLLILVAVGKGMHRGNSVGLQTAAQHSQSAPFTASPTSASTSQITATSHSNSGTSKSASSAQSSSSSTSGQSAAAKNIRDDAALKAQLDHGNPDNATMNQDLSDVASDLNNTNE